MIRFDIAYCPCCMLRLHYDKQGQYFWCECDGWSHLKFSDRQKELDAAETYDTRHLLNVGWKGENNGNKKC